MYNFWTVRLVVRTLTARFWNVKDKNMSVQCDSRAEVDSIWNVMAHGDAREGKVKGKLANGVGSQYSSNYLGTWCIQHYYRWCRTPRLLPVVDWTDAPADLNGLIRCAERRNLVSARVPSHLKCGLQQPRNCAASKLLLGFAVGHERAKSILYRYIVSVLWLLVQCSEINVCKDCQLKFYYVKTLRIIDMITAI